MAMYHDYVSWLCIMAVYHDCIMTLYHDYVSWPCIMAMYHGYVSWVCIMGTKIKLNEEVEKYLKWNYKIIQKHRIMK